MRPPRVPRARLRAPRSLHGRLILLLLASFAALLATLTVGLARGSQMFFEEVHCRLDAGVAEHIAQTIHVGPGGTWNENELKALFTDVMVINPSLEVYLIDSRGRILAYDAPEERILRRTVDLEPVRTFLALPPGAVVKGDDPRSAVGRKPISVALVQGSGAGEQHMGFVYVILGGQGYDSVLAPLRQSWVVQGAVALAAGLLLVTTAIGSFAVMRLTRPLRALRGRMAAFQSLEHSQEAHEARDEVAELGMVFEALRTRILAQMREMEANDARRREFVAGVSHDLRTPASALQGYLETALLRTKRGDPAQLVEHLELALRQARRLGALVDQLFQLAHLEARQGVRREEFSLAELVQDTVREFEGQALRKSITLRAQFPYDLPSVNADIALIQRALDNLIDNALRYGTPGSEVVLRLNAIEGQVRVCIWNSGQTIPRDELNLVFEPYYRGRAAALSVAGTGLGLAITRSIIAVHDGAIEVSSNEGEGTTFSFALPGIVQTSPESKN